MAELLAQGSLPARRERISGMSAGIGTAALDILAPFVRLLELLDEPEATPVLAPLIQRELHYRQLTAMSPLQYQKCLRLSEAKRLMLNEHLDVSSAAFKVGYESPSQFSREYTRQFCTAPKRDITQLRSLAYRVRRAYPVVVGLQLFAIRGPFK